MKPILPDSELRNRRDVTEPGMQAWVSANAGSGKTSILRDKVIRLLLAGVAPERILCLTFTKAAAAEMQGRIFQELARWVLLDETALGAEIANLTDDPTPSKAVMRRARRLFAEAIETPGGLKIQTIHAFAERVLQLCPIEAGVPVRFSVLDEPQAEGLRRAARRRLIEKATDTAPSPLGLAFRTALEAATSAGFEDAIDEALALLSGDDAGFQRDEPARESALRRFLGLPQGKSREAVLADIAADFPPASDVMALAEAILANKPTEKQRIRADMLTRFAQHRDDASIAALRKELLTFGDNGHFHAKAHFVPAAVGRKAPHLAEQFAMAAETMGRHVDAGRAFAVLEHSLALGVLATAILRAYRQEKRLRSSLDFNDLIAALRRLLRSGQAGWVMMKFDAAIDHVLVDEAQDTSTAMWEIVLALTDDFFTGEGQNRRPRSIFVVGDEKQSIYSFQGADPQAFEEARLEFSRRIEAARLPNHVRRPKPLLYSFRSSPVVLEAVDSVFRGARAEGLGTQLGQTSLTNEPATQHNAAFPEKPGLVELWPLELDPARKEQPDLDADEEAPAAPPRKKAVLRLAERIAGRIRAWLDAGTERYPGGPPITAGDILILVQQRGTFFHAILKALKRRAVPVAGADRMQLAEEIVVQDLLVLAEAALLPQDDLALATALRCPIYGITDAELEALARRRPGALIRALEASESARLAASREHFATVCRRAQECEPYAFFMHVLNAPHPLVPEMNGRQALLTRLGPDAEEAIRAFLDAALAFSAANPAALQAFIAAQRKATADIKRDLESSGDAVRVMTVHGAKGLEAPIVFLPDMARKPNRGKEPHVLVEAGPSLPVLLWSPDKNVEPKAIRTVRARRRAAAFGEYRRLLYVAMTRASERLYLCGFGKAAAKDAASKPLQEAPGEAEAEWYALVTAGLPEGRVCPDGVDDEGNPRFVRRLGADLDTRSAAPHRQRASSRLAPEPLREPGPMLRPDDAVAALVPSRAGEGAERTSGSWARLRGEWIHRLFEVLPRHPEDTRPGLGARLLEEAAPGLSHDARQDMLGLVLASLGLPEAAPFFGADARAEVPVAGRIGLPGGHQIEVSGRIDRLVVTGNVVLCLDIKTGARHGPWRAANLRQMALYTEVLAAMYPAKELRAALLWATEPALEWLEAKALQAALSDIGVDSR